ncbi:hypothetical protein RMSM_05346 [Rhodopirellula maiorica SM1]|uniref:Uncharacterized protein n=1 Tax=Rhodopirellula maiorica SM1 TaxID=1265738 RepID=M5RQQ1_9BACT|nr:hypothetical protein RMSM_05346 [Rhodopirellula maiorica SM1]
MGIAFLLSELLAVVWRIANPRPPLSAAQPCPADRAVAARVRPSFRGQFR